jgi:ribosomal protein S18 acetylase RimI-like enzyme
MDASSVITEDATNELEAVLLCSRVREDVGHITQICVTPEHRGHGLGRLLVTQCAAHLTRRKFEAITLTVTESNTHAVELYKQMGFFVRHRFDALVWESANV